MEATKSLVKVSPAAVQVGWLENGDTVICLTCKDHGNTFDKAVVPLFDVNLKPYRQQCACCGIELVELHCGVTLFSGKL